MLGRCTTGPCRKYGLFCTRTPLCSFILPPPLPADRKRRRVRFLSLAAPAGVANVRRGLARQRLPAHRPGHFGRDAARPRQSREREVEPRLPQLVVAEALVEPISGHVAHLVIELRPFHRAASEAEGDDLDSERSDPLLRHPVTDPPPRDLRIIGTCLRANKVFCPRTRPHPRPQRATLVIHSPSTDFSPRPPVGKPATDAGLARARAIERVVAEPRAHGIERGVQPRHPG